MEGNLDSRAQKRRRRWGPGRSARGGLLVNSDAYAGKVCVALVVIGLPADLDDDCIVGINDFLQLLANWGSCT